MFSGDAHRKSGVFQLWFISKPGGVMLPPEPDELTPLIYSYKALNASEEMEKCDGGSNGDRKGTRSYLIKSDSRSWSRPTNDFTVR
jgi:hypothetical protein